MSDVFGVDLSSYADNTVLGDGYVRIQWINGDAKSFGAAAKQRGIQPVPGHLFVAADRLPEGVVPGAPWIEWTEQFRSGDVDGYRADVVQAVIIAHRQQPYAQVGDRREWLERWDRSRQGIRMHADIMMLVEGIEMLGPVVLGTNSTLVALAFTAAGGKGRAPGIIPTIAAELVDPANRVAKRTRLAVFAFWVRLQAETDAKGNAVFTPTQGQAVTRPVVVLPAAATDAEKTKRAVAAYVGNEVLQNDILPAVDAAQAWRTHRFTDQPDETDAVRNVPQPVDVDIEF